MTPRPKRGEPVPPPPEGDQWDLRYATKESLGLVEAERQLPGTVAKAKVHMRTNPLTRTDVCKPLRGSLGTRSIRGQDLPQWQYDISSGGRIWYCPDADNHVVWVTYASAGHPRATSAKNKRGGSTR